MPYIMYPEGTDLSRFLFILNDKKEPVAVPTFEEWTEWYHKNDRRVALDKVLDAEVSTVFLGLNHSGQQRNPKVFETQIFGGFQDRLTRRYCTWEEAEAGHKEVLELVKSFQN